VAILRLLTLLPFRLQMWFGRAFGRLGYRFIAGRRRIAQANIRLCFPELDEAARNALVKRHFESLGMGVFDMALSWWASDARADRFTTVTGLEHLQAAQQTGRGIILLSGHFAGTELTGRCVVKHLPKVAAFYRPVKNKLADQFLRRGRVRAVTAGLIAKDDTRQMIRLLRGGGTVWYASDQSYARKYHELVTFFGEPAMTNAALTQIARIGNALVVPYIPRRRDDCSGYVAAFLPPLENFPTDDPAADALRVNELLEAHIRRAPEQYLWIHRRFKDRPQEFEDPYVPR
jgi:KDO2-lipid IV(A) lauroyltransferase